MENDQEDSNGIVEVSPPPQPQGKRINGDVKEVIQSVLFYAFQCTHWHTHFWKLVDKNSHDVTLVTGQHQITPCTQSVVKFDITSVAPTLCTKFTGMIHKLKFSRYTHYNL